MKPSPERIRELFVAAVGKADARLRDAFLDQASGGDEEAVHEVRQLLEAHENAASFLDFPAIGPTIDDGARPSTELPGTVIGPYKLLEQIGEGGMGVVYMAEQTEPMRRKVALKVIKPGMDTKRVIARFEAERQALALMDHPNIARILDAGATESGRPYFVMELVRGIPITEYCDGNHLAIADRLDLFVLVCLAVQHAHLKGIIHRDLKPSNVLITVHDGVALPKIIDFGIAKATGHESLTDRTLFTAFAELLGTPMYLSPEQAELSAVDVDTRSDIYSLGVLLYELLTGTTPFDHDTFRRAALDEVRRIIREEEPLAPSTRILAPSRRGGWKWSPETSLSPKEFAASTNRQTDSRKLNHALRGELDWITMKALEKDRRRRYETAGAFGADIVRYRRYQAVEAGPPSLWYRGRKFARRHRLALASTTIVMLSLAVITGILAWSAVSLNRARRATAIFRSEANRRAIQARHHRYAADIRQAYELWLNVQVPRVLELLDKWTPRSGEPDVRNFAWHFLRRLCHDEKRTLAGHSGAVYHTEFSPDGRTLASCGKDGMVRLWEVESGRCLRTINAHRAEVNFTAFAPDGSTLATVSDDGTIRLWNLEARSEEPEASISAHDGDAIAVCFTRDGGRLISAGRNDGLVKLWDRKTRKELASTHERHGEVESLVLAPDGKTIATAGGDGYARLWSSADLTPRGSFQVQRQAPIYDLAFSTDGALLATGDGLGRLQLWKASTGKLQQEFPSSAQIEGIHGLCFLDGDRGIISAVNTGNLKRWAVGADSFGWLLGHTQKVWGISVSPDGSTFATASSDGTAKLWETGRSPAWLSIPVPDGGTSIDFSADGRTLIEIGVPVGRWYQPPSGAPGHFLDATPEVNGFDAKTGAPRFHRVFERGRICSQTTRLSTDGTIAYFVRPEGTGKVWEAWNVSTETRQSMPEHAVPIDRSQLLAIHESGKSIELVDVLTGRQSTLRGTEWFDLVASDRQGRVVAIRTLTELAIWEQATNKIRKTSRAMETQWSVAEFSPDATILATCPVIPRGEIQLWDVNTLELLDTLPGHPAVVNDLAFSPDGRVLASVGADGLLKLWDVAARMELLTLRRVFEAPSALRFAPDGRTLAFRGHVDGKNSVCVLTTALPEDLDANEGR